nr:hypothetical protein BCU49_13060 [Vibrio breoganii]
MDYCYYYKLFKSILLKGNELDVHRKSTNELLQFLEVRTKIFLLPYFLVGSDEKEQLDEIAN